MKQMKRFHLAGCFWPSVSSRFHLCGDFGGPFHLSFHLSLRKSLGNFLAVGGGVVWPRLRRDKILFGRRNSNGVGTLDGLACSGTEIRSRSDAANLGNRRGLRTV